MVAAVQAHQPSFPGDIDANQLDLRLLATVVLGERLRVDPENLESQYLAALVRSATHLHPLPAEVHLSKLVNDLITVADQSLSRASKALRKRKDWPNLSIEGADVAALAESTNASLGELVRILASNMEADREEVEVLWWVFGARCSRTGDRFDAMPDGERALVAATELSERMLMPPIATSAHLLASLVPEAPSLSAAQLVPQLSKGALSAFLRRRKSASSVLNAHAALLPTTWLSARLIDSELSPGWEAEFEKKTHIRSDRALPLATWSRQFFAECVAQELGHAQGAEDVE